MTLGTSGTSFTLDGQRVTYAGLSEFRLLDLFVHGKDITPLLRDRQAVMQETIASPFLRTLRVFSMAQSFMQLGPGDYPYTSVSALTDYVNEFGFVIDWEGLADCDQSNLSVAAQRVHVHRMIEALRGRKALFSLGNEYGKNGWKPEDFPRPDGVLVSRGSGLGGEYPPIEEWDYSDYHTRRDGVKGLAAPGRYLCFVVGGDNDATPAWKGLRNPCVIKEWLGAADQSQSNRRSNRPNDHYRTGFDMAAWGAGGCFHSDNGIMGELFTPQQRACALAHFMGMSKADPVQRFDGTVG